jgi:two-component system OmpR family response regulator
LNLFDVVVADYLALGPSPIEIVEKLTHSGAPPLIVLAGEIDELESIDLLKAGAAYCLTNAIGQSELKARIEALAIRQNRLLPQALLLEEWLVDFSGKRLITPQLDMPGMTRVEFELLELFVGSGERVLSRTYLLNRLGKLHEVLTERAVDVYVSRLRRKLQTWGAGEVMRITAARNEGYLCVTSVRPTPLRQIRSAQSPSRGEARA